MKAQSVNPKFQVNPGYPSKPGTTPLDNSQFQSILNNTLSTADGNPPSPKTGVVGGLRVAAQTQPRLSANADQAAAAYRQQEVPKLSGWEKYKEDQLLSTPGGDMYDLTSNRVEIDPARHESFLGRVGKDFSDSLACFTNGVKSLFLGTESCYRDGDGNINKVKKTGVLGAVGNMLKNVGSALSLGFWHPDQEKAPEGVAERAGFVFSRLKHAVLGDLIQGVGGGAVSAGKHLVLAGWNLAEVAPDATIGNIRAGRELTTKIFDNGQVMISYLTDILPTGEAWLRVHASDIGNAYPPVTYNLNLKEHYDGDERWRYIRNTPFRKTIETIGSLLADVVTAKLISGLFLSSEGSHKKPF